jgi:hypothetical protein
LLPLHGGKGGPLRCPLCVGKWNAEHGRRRKTGRIVIRTIKAFLDAGGNYDDIDKLRASALTGGGDLFGVHLDPLGYMDGIAQFDDADIELTSELLADVLKLTHPDHHPPERKELAHRVTQQLLALQPFVFPAPKPKPPPDLTSKPPTRPRKSEPKPSAPQYPCPDCADTTPYFYCDACRAEYEKRQLEEDERRKAKQREQYARRPKMWTPPKPPPGTPKPRNQRQSMVAVNQIPGTNLINHGLSGLQAAILVTAFTKRVPGAQGADVSQAELLAEIWGWKPSYELRWTEEKVARLNKHLDRRAGDTCPPERTHGAFNHIPRFERRRARASLSRAITRLDKRMLISFVSGSWWTYGGGLVLTPHGERIARQLLAEREHADVQKASQ